MYIIKSLIMHHIFPAFLFRICLPMNVCILLIIQLASLVCSKLEYACSCVWYEAVLPVYLQDRKNILKVNKEVRMLLPKKDLIQVE